MSTPKNTWVQLYQARQVKAEIPESRSPGRPPSPIPRRKVGLTLSSAEITELEAWQSRLTALMGRKISTGETVGILTRIASARLARLGPDSYASLVELVEKMIGEG